MKTGRRIVLVACMVALGAGLARAEDPAAKPAMTPEQQAKMDAMMKLGSPSEGHKVLEPVVGKFSYTAQFWMTPEAPPESMTGSSDNQWVFGGRFLKQWVTGQGMGNGPFEGEGYTGYDNIRKEYQSVWMDNMMTGMMLSTGTYDAASKTLTQTGDGSCPMTGEAHRQMRSVLKIVDNDHHVYESYTNGPDGKEFKSMVIEYTRAQ